VGNTKKGISYSPAFASALDRAGGQRRRQQLARYLDVGENPPNGAIVYYWLPEGFAGAVRFEPSPMRAATRSTPSPATTRTLSPRRSRRRNRA